MIKAVGESDKTVYFLVINNYYKSEPLVNGMVNKSLISVISG